MEWLIGSIAILFSLWVLAQDPTIQTFRRRMRFDAETSPSIPESRPDDIVVVLPPNAVVPAPRRRKRRR